MMKPNFLKLGIAWLFLCVALAVHVIDEASNDFLDVYNPIAESINLPTFTYWLFGLIVMIIFLMLLSILAFKGKKIMTALSFIFGSVMAMNGLMHIIGSFYFGYLIAGTYSAPLLLLASFYLLRVAIIRNSLTEG